MSARLAVVDSGGTTRFARRLAVVDSGGTTRLAKRVFVVDSGGTSRLVFTGTLLETTLTEGVWDDLFANEGFGRSYSRGSGSMSNYTLSNGYAVHTLEDFGPYGGPYEGQLTLSGFSSDPGQNNVFDTVVVAGVSRAASAASYYSYNSSFGLATWVWASPFGIDGSGSSSVVINSA